MVTAVVSCFFFLSVGYVGSTTLHFGLLGPTRKSFCGYESPAVDCIDTMASALDLAIEEARHDGLLNDTDIGISWADDHCSGKEGVAAAIKLVEKDQVGVIFGSVCSVVEEPVGYYASAKNLPLFTPGATDPALQNKAIHPTLVRFGPNYNTYGAGVSKMMQFFNWTHAGMLTESTITCENSAQSVEKHFALNNITVTVRLRLSSLYGAADNEVDLFWDKLIDTTRILITCVNDKVLQRFLLRGHRRGLTQSGKYVIIGHNLIATESQLLYPWVNLDEKSRDVRYEIRMAFKPYKLITMSGLMAPKVITFKARVTDMLMNVTHWLYTPRSEQASPYSVLLYDAVYFYCVLYNQTRSTMGYLDGRYVGEVAKNALFNGITGDVMLDEFADRESNLELWQVKDDRDEMSPFARVFLSSLSKEQELLLSDEVSWYTPDNTVPEGLPVCGFLEDLCEITSEQNLEVLMISGYILIGVGAIVGIFFARKLYLRSQITIAAWKINFEDIAFAENKSTKTTMPQSDQSMDMISGMSNALACGLYNGNRVAVISFATHNTDVQLTKKDMLSYSRMREFNHDNVNTFIGASLIAPNVCVCYSFCAKGSVFRILENTDIQLDINFKASLITDLVNGLSYIHDSSIGHHGNLTSDTCMVDSRWVLKVSGYGMRPFRMKEIGQLKEKDEEEYYNAFLWTAPELLRKPDEIALTGSPKGDIYSCGIILQEILYQAKPYFIRERLTAKEVVSRVHKVERPFYRPRLPKEEKDAVNYINVMIQCWEEDPADRPTVGTLRRVIRTINPMKGNVVDAMIRRLEKYATNLEELVTAKTEELVQEKKKTDRLLYRMLPPMVADALKLGRTIQPETFKSVTIYFSDIVGFTAFCARSTAPQVVTILNDLYTLFDSTIVTYNVYKVETIGDAYMVVSGAPATCPDHAVQIAEMSLALLDAVANTFNVTQHPDKPQELRVGLHSGSCVAGVVGKTMPRYCLFGDTVNTASRMESNGAPMKIHVSPTTHDLLEQAGGFILEDRGLLELKVGFKCFSSLATLIDFRAREK